jgi:hypothetical protein
MNKLQVTVVADGVSYPMPTLSRRAGETDSQLSERAVAAAAAYIGYGQLGKIESMTGTWS